MASVSIGRKQGDRGGEIGDQLAAARTFDRGERRAVHDHGRHQSRHDEVSEAAKIITSAATRTPRSFRAVIDPIQDEIKISVVHRLRQLSPR